MKLVYVGTKTKYEVEVKAIKANVLEVDGDLPMKEVGFTLIDDDKIEYDYTAYRTLYRSVEGGYQFSNDGEVWDEPTKTVTVAAAWNDKDDYEGLRPESVTVRVFDGEIFIEDVILCEENEWKKDYDDVPESHTFAVEAVDVDNYEMAVSGTTVTYTMEAPYEPSTDEVIGELTDMIIELDERVSALEEG